MSDDLYQRDILLWSEREAALLRRLALGERVNDSVDWAHVIEELADVGLSELHAVQSLLEQAMTHLLTCRADPEAAAVRHWRPETRACLARARRRHASSMNQRIDRPALWHEAALQTRDVYPDVTTPAACPWTLDELLAEDAEPAALAALLG